ncbi:hypothetical protein CEXT_640941 [Caerostris extrusa]|uniref:Uncharacterized protein n=1 Tax=Caerostris extrusa TaxID=172846 RepID=A0AAV4MXX4_CAEEX|nr:hypothetical protein CEXT_640941 [Caerostris extrusa]
MIVEGASLAFRESLMSSYGKLGYVIMTLQSQNEADNTPTSPDTKLICSDKSSDELFPLSLLSCCHRNGNLIWCRKKLSDSFLLLHRSLRYELQFNEHLC